MRPSLFHLVWLACVPAFWLGAGGTVTAAGRPQAATASAIEQTKPASKPSTTPRFDLNLDTLPDEAPRYDPPGQAPGANIFLAGVRAYQQGDRPEAGLSFQRILDLFPDSPLIASARAFLAELVVEKDQTVQGHVAAIAAYQQILSAHPGTPNAARAGWRIGDLYAEIALRPEADGAYARANAQFGGGRDADRALLGSAVNKAAWGKLDDAEKELLLLRGRTDDETLLRVAAISLADVACLQGRFREAAGLYDAAFRQWPDVLKARPFSLMAYARAYEGLGKSKDSQRLYLLAYNLHPHHAQTPEALVRLGDGYHRQGDVAKARQFYTLAISRHPGGEVETVSRLRLAQMSADIVARDPARSLALTVHSLMEKEPGLLVDDQDREAELRRIAKAAGRPDVGNEALFALGKHYEFVGNLSEAVLRYRELAGRESLAHDDVWPAEGRKRLKTLLEPWVVSALAFEDDITAVRLFQMHGDEGDQLYQGTKLAAAIAAAYHRLGFLPQAVHLYQSALRGKPTDEVREQALVGLGHVYLDQDDPPAARQVLQRYRLQFPLGGMRGEVLLTLAHLSQRENDYEGVVRLCQKWLKAFPSHRDRSEVLLMMAEASANAGNAKAAMAAYEQVERLKVLLSPGVTLRHGKVIEKAGHGAVASRWYQSLIRRNPDTDEAAWARLYLAGILRGQRQFREARAMLTPLTKADADPLLAKSAAVLNADIDREGG